VVFVNLRHTQLIVILGIALLLIAAFPVAAANISGLKYNDFNHNGNYDPTNTSDPDDKELGLANWNISVFYLNGTYTGIHQLTNSQGNYFFSGLDGDLVYLVREDLAGNPGWYNSTPTEVLADFKNTTVYPAEALVTGAAAQQILPVQNIAFAARSLWGSTGNYHQDLEWENPFAVKCQTRTSINPHWINNTIYDFNLTYDPTNPDPNKRINYTVFGPPSPASSPINFTVTSIYAPANLTGTTTPINEIEIFARANTGSNPARMEITNLVLTNGSATYNVVNSSIADSLVAPSQTHLMIRANKVLGPGADIATQGFTLTGKQKFIYPNPVPSISSAAFAVQINVGNDNLTPLDLIEQFGNYQHTGEIEGYKFSDDNGNSVWDIGNFESPLEFWQVNLYYSNNTYMRSVLTDDEGEYEFYLPYGSYIVKEEPQAGYNQTTGKDGYAFTIDDSTFHITDKNFGNQLQLIFNISGYKYNDLNGNGKRDAGEPGLTNWTIGIGNSTIPYYASNTTDANGNYSFINVPPGTYIVNETLIPGWKNTTPLNQTACIPQFPYLPPPHLELPAEQVVLALPNSYLSTTVSGVNPTMGYDVQNKAYPAWCADLYHYISQNTIYDLWSFVDSSPPYPPGLISNFPTVSTTPWDKINYMLNRKAYYYSQGANANAFQAAIWNYTNSIALTPGYNEGGVSLDATQLSFAQQMIADANVNGTGYTPPCGGVKAIFMNVSAEDYGTTQLTFIEVPVRCCGSTSFGNQQLGNITGFKNESVSGAGLAGWNITLVNSTTGYYAWNITNSSGGYNFTSIPYGTYSLNETPQAGYTQSLLTPNKTVTIGMNNLTLFYNFTNTQQLGNVTGDKVNYTGTGLGGWTITLQNLTIGTPLFINITFRTYPNNQIKSAIS